MKQTVEQNSEFNIPGTESQEANIRSLYGCIFQFADFTPFIFFYIPI